ncbi:UbiH/UbiF family hydroxylase [Rhizobium sp. LjRoot254]|uniref:UbiH/UbiF family hydroxylase n=1 Tax=Rhizobium sp. LjRoot254 TaxID=3342297 RepID=UPI003ECCE9E2
MAVFDVAVAGGGLAGQIGALAFAKNGFSTVLIAPDDGRTDQRTTALMDHSLGFLTSLGIWDRVRPEAAALSTMQIIDATERLLHAPPVTFRASEIGLEAFGYNIPNAPFLAILSAALGELPNVTMLTTSVERVDLSGELAMLHLADGADVTAGLVIAADGRKSLIRDAAGIDARSHAYPQTAVVLNFAHDRPHHNVSTEFHTRTGPFTQVPLPGQRSSLVWVVKPEEAVEILQLPADVLNRRVEDRMQSILGRVTVEGKPQAWPLSAATATRFGKGQVALIGEAAHVFPPIGAQGLNLSLRDIESALELALVAQKTGARLAIGDAYDRKRRADIWSRTAAIDLLNRSLLSGLLPVQMLRAVGMHMLSAIPPLRYLAMHEGVAPGRGFSSFPDFLRKEIRRKHA